MERISVGKSINHLEEDTASVIEKAQLVRAQGATEICADIRKMVNNADYSDVVFLCNDGVRVHGCRFFLVARSEVLYSMLLNGMAESQLSEITLQGISSTTLLPVMEFLYTATLQEHMPRDWRSAYDIIGAARFFLVEKLELIAVEHLLLAVAKVRGNIKDAAKFLCIAVEFLGVYGEAVGLIARSLVCILESTSLEPEHLHALTAEAFGYFLEKTKRNDENPGFFLQAEFLCLKHIILWCACRDFVPKEALTESSVTFPPEIKSISELLDESVSYGRPFQPSELYNGIKTTLALSVKEYLPLVNFRRIPSDLLVKIIEPMDIVPSSIIMDAFRVQALQASDFYFYRWIADKLSWSTSCTNREIYRMSRDGAVIEQVAEGFGFARCNFPIRHTGRDIMSIWEITIEKVCRGFIEIGFQHELEGNFGSEEGQNLAEQPAGWALRMDTEGLFVNRRGKHDVESGDLEFVPSGNCSQLVYGKDFGQKSSKIEVSFDSMDKICSISVDNDRFTNSEWVDIPYGNVYPAVSLGDGPLGRVRIKILNV